MCMPAPRESELRVHVDTRCRNRICATCASVCTRAHIGVARNATGVAAMRFRSSTGVYRVYRAVIVAVW